MSTIGLLAAAVAGHDVPVESSTRGVYTDGTTIFLPIDDPSSSVTAAVICQAALLATGSLAPERMRRLARAGAVATERYLALEVVRSCATLDPVLPAGLRSAVRSYGDQVGPSTSAEESLARALGRGALAPPPPWFGELHPRLATRGSTGGEPLEPDERVAEAIRRAQEQQDASDDDSDDEPPSRIARLLSTPIKNPLGSMLMNVLGARRSAGDGASGGTEISSISAGTGVGRGRPGAWTIAPAHRARDVVGGHRYPEWNDRSGAYRDDWCTVTELDPSPAESAGEPGRTDQALLRELAGLSRGYQVHRRRPQGSELDLDALVDHRAALLSGTSAEPDVYTEDLRSRPDLAVLVLLDATGSAAEHTGGSSLFDAQRRLAAELTTALDQLGARVASYAFYSRGRHHVRFLRCKTFDERWGVAAQRRMGSLTPSGFTRLGAAVRHGTHVLETYGGCPRRLLVVVGDGIAYDDGYEGIYAVEDSRRSVTEATDRGIACVGISAAEPADGQPVWPPDAHRVVTEPGDLAREVRTFFGTALHHARRPPRGAAS